MKLLTFKENGFEMLGVLSKDEQTVYSLSEIGLSYFNMTDLISRFSAEDRKKIEDFLKDPQGGTPYASVEKCSPIPRPAQDIICLGINYGEHATEASRYSAEAFGGERPYPIYFSKRVNEAIPDGGSIPLHDDIEERLDYESELAVIIGKEARNVPEDRAYEYVFGYSVINDVSARILQTRHKQWYFGKSLDGATPFGPVILTSDEVPGKPVLKIQSLVNGELRQDSVTDHMIFDVAYVIAELSRGMTLLPGSVIAMGTPAGVGMGMQPPVFLKRGDKVECRIEKIGSLTNTVI